MKLPITVRLPKELMDKVLEDARKQKRKKSALIEFRLTEFYERNEKEKGKSNGK